MEKQMKINRETAMRLWTSRYGKSKRAVDFAGRTMDKAAYDDRNSDYGWNIDHIFPESKGGRTADHNLVCCHIRTNDEKADKICFNANGRSFQVVKVENHYEIVSAEGPDDESRQPTLFDSAYGVRRFDQLFAESKKQKFCGEILLDLRQVQTSALLDFAMEVFDTENVAVTSDGRGGYLVSIKSYDVGLKSLVQGLLDKCLLLNTYLRHYFIPIGVLGGYDIYFDVSHGETGDDYFVRSRPASSVNPYFGQATDTIYLGELAIENTDAKKELDAGGASGVRTVGVKKFVRYPYEFTRLGENLDKEVSRQE